MNTRSPEALLRYAGRWVVLLLVVAAGIRAGPLFAQAGGDGTRPLRPGDELRIASPIYSGRAVHLGEHGDTLTVRTRPRGRTLALPVDALVRLERHRRVPRLQRALDGAKWGALGGAAVGTLGIVMSERGPGDPPQVWWPLVGAAVFTGPTALVYAAVPAYEWREVPLPPRGQARLAPVPGGVALRLTW